jgi:hypothetical protein
MFSSIYLVGLCKNNKPRIANIMNGTETIAWESFNNTTG